VIIKLVQYLCLNIKICKKYCFGEIEFDDDFHKIRKIHDDVKDDDDFNKAKIHKIYNVLNDILCIGVPCDALKSRLSQSNKERTLKRIINDKFYNIFNNGLKFVKIELITNDPGKLCYVRMDGWMVERM